MSVSEGEATVTLNSNTVRAMLSNELNFSGSIHFAGIAANSTPGDSGSTTKQIYIGCMTNITVNSQPVVVGREGVQSGYSSGCCVPPRRPLQSNPQLFTWWNISITGNTVAVDEGDVVTITTLHIPVWPPGEIENRIMLEVVNETQFGVFTRGASKTEVSRFRYSDLVFQANDNVVSFLNWKSIVCHVCPNVIMSMLTSRVSLIDYFV